MLAALVADAPEITASVTALAGITRAVRAGGRSAQRDGGRTVALGRRRSPTRRALHQLSDHSRADPL